MGASRHIRGSCEVGICLRGVGRGTLRENPVRGGGQASGLGGASGRVAPFVGVEELAR